MKLAGFTYTPGYGGWIAWWRMCLWRWEWESFRLRLLDAAVPVP